MNGIDKMWAVDLLDMQAFAKDSNGIKYLLTVIDIFSKFVWIVFVKRKTGQKVCKRISEDLTRMKTK